MGENLSIFAPRLLSKLIAVSANKREARPFPTEPLATHTGSPSSAAVGFLSLRISRVGVTNSVYAALDRCAIRTCF